MHNVPVMRAGRLVGAAAACALAAAACAPVAATAAGPRTLTVMTFNIASAVETDNNLDPIADAIDLQEADVAGLQEVDRSWSRSDSLDQAREFALRLGMTYRFDPVVDCSAQDTDGDGFCRYGTAVVSRFPMRAATARDYSLPRAGEEEPRGLAEVGVNVRGRRLIVFNTHLSEVASARRAQVREILRVVAATRGPYILMGDFNARPNAPEIGWVRRRLTDTARLKRVQRPTVGNTRIDYVFASKGITVLSAHVPPASWRRVSDHRPLIVKLRLDRTP
jgi:endonuclease/exonuclease/phosphatase family metal-dependent hydrolase